MKKWLLINFLIIFFIFAGCSTGPDEDLDDMIVDDYYPMNLGNEWTYEMELLNFTDTFTCTITETQKWNDRTVYKKECGTGTMEWAVYCDGELRIYSSFPTDTSDYYIRLKEPVEEGNTWVTSNGNDTLEITSVEVSVSVPAGTFENCIKVNKGDNNYRLYARDVGIVKRQYSNIEVEELINYSVNR